MLTFKDISSIRGTGKVPEYRDVFPPELKNYYDDRLVKLLGEAGVAIGNLNSYARIVPNPDLLIVPLLLREALSSSRIEGTQATALDIVKRDAGVELSGKIQEESLEVINHREATYLGLKLLKRLPLVSRVTKKMHKRLLQEVRGDIKRPGDFREGPNVVARREAVDSIIYLPPPAKKVDELMTGLERYINQNANAPSLLKCAAIHYEFEAIHPFADGNGRLGRVLIPLFLLKEGVLEYPLLYISGYLLKNRDEYYNLLLKVTTDEDWKSWLLFFLRGAKEQAEKSRELLEEIYSLFRRYQDRAGKEIKSPYIRKLVEATFTHPGITGSKAKDILGCTHNTAMSLLRELAKLDLLVEDKNKKRDIPFYNAPLIEFLEKAG